MEIKTLAVLVLGGAFDGSELGDNDIEMDSNLIEEIQLERVNGWDDVRVELVERAHVDHLIAERDALQQLLNARDDEVGRLRSAGNEMLRIAAIANQGSAAYNRAIVNLHQTLENKA